MSDVFISYAREDRAQAERIARGLEAMGLSVFWDNEIPPGQTWADYIESKLNQCNAAVVLWSENSTKSQWVREEARMGRSKLIPAKLDVAEPPFGFGDVQAADLSSWGGDYNHPQWGRFANAVFAKARPAGAQPAAAATPHVAPTPQPPAGGWQQPQSNQSGGGWQTPPPAQQQQAWSTGSQAPSGVVENLTPVQYIQKCLRLFVDGKGRARRAEYWWWALAVIVVSIVLGVLELTLFGLNAYGQPNSQILSTVFSLAVAAPGISVASRRFHDVGLNGWLVAGFVVAIVIGQFLTMSLNPLGAGLMLIAGLGMLVITVMPSKPGPNQYGPNPKGL
ncbi:MAG: DUF805 domain-containing protein [Hyphomonadaceae bacterium]|nr:DUF805 domain-containing protein [Hyphomonadaceae bacterium]